MSAPFEYDRSRAMKQTDFEPCARCGKGVAHAGLPVFYRVTVEQMGIDGRAAQRQHGLEQMLGGAAGLAFHMGPQADIGLPIGEGLKGLLCQTCALDFDVSFGEVTDALARSGERRKGNAGDAA